MKELTKVEEQIMQILWQLEKGFVNDIIKELPEPKPAYSTVSTIVRILANKGFVAHRVYGNTHEYFPLISKESYKKRSLNKLVNNYFDNSYKNLVSFFAQDDKISEEELKEMKKMIEDELKNKK
ncbi:MAG: BlaI/MecI/CopY family transcriptional regulator [Bacteroidales bacterium]|nr:BlaI/MecI/CopY family transcriptional regulator [Bacteroidales bacterium]MDD4217681.1 BlaI/MecI/CopY family transcriptional regulator [Bacteroidales bacterium]MDY0142523.1 BlaI/MecI/CopY family transcriptional regulator [Bacteroidales bacterium]